MASRRSPFVLLAFLLVLVIALLHLSPSEGAASESSAVSKELPHRDKSLDKDSHDTGGNHHVIEQHESHHHMKSGEHPHQQHHHRQHRHHHHHRHQHPPQHVSHHRGDKNNHNQHHKGKQHHHHHAAHYHHQGKHHHHQHPRFAPSCMNAYKNQVTSCLNQEYTCLKAVGGVDSFRACSNVVKSCRSKARGKFITCQTQSHFKSVHYPAHHTAHKTTHQTTRQTADPTAHHAIPAVTSENLKPSESAKGLERVTVKAESKPLSEILTGGGAHERHECQAWCERNGEEHCGASVFWSSACDKECKKCCVHCQREMVKQNPPVRSWWFM